MELKGADDVYQLRPWLENNKSWVLEGGIVKPSPVQARLSKEEWRLHDGQVTQSFREATPVTTYLMEHRLFLGCDGIARAQLPGTTTENVSVKAFPLPFTHHDFLEVSSCQMSARLVGAEVEKTVLGLTTAHPDIYGFRNAPHKVMMTSVAQGMSNLKEAGYYGPYVLICSSDLQKDMFAAYSCVVGIEAVIASEHLKGEQLILFQATPDVVRLVIGLNPILLQWDSEKFKVVCVVVPQIRGDLHNNFGIACSW